MEQELVQQQYPKLWPNSTNSYSHHSISVTELLITDTPFTIKLPPIMLLQ